MRARGTDWRQGDVLKRESVAKLGLTNDENDALHLVIITHDCDLANPNESFVELIAASRIEQAEPDPQLTYCKNPRKIHLTYDSDVSGALILELQHAHRHVIPKNNFNEFAIKDNKIRLSRDDKRTLKQWLAARYGRPAFPDQFESRLRKKKGSREVYKCIDRILKPDAQYVVGLYFDLGEARREDLTEEPYTLRLYVVYDSSMGATKARTSAERIADRLRDLFHTTYGKPDKATEIALEECNAVSDTHMSIADLRQVDQWRAEHVSLGSSDNGDFLALGEVP